MFLPTAFIGEKTLTFKECECLTWGEVRELNRAGIEFGSHTVNHPKLYYELDAAQIRRELAESKAAIERELGEPIVSFAYPYAFPSADRAFVEMFTGLLRETGYESNVTTRIGRVRAEDDAFTLKRLPVNSADDGALFLAKIRGAYDWMNWPQDTFKKVKSLTGRGQARRRRAGGDGQLMEVNMNSRRYIIIAPVRNEEAHLPGTIESIAAQTVRPVRLILVNDGSTDQTAKIAAAAAKVHPWITVVDRADRGFRRNGGGVVETFYDGFKLIGDEPWDYLIKLDGDLSFAPDYFQKCLERFEKDPKLGIGGGTILHQHGEWRGSGIEGRPGVSCAGGDEDLPARMLGRDWRIIARGGVGHHGRS